MFFNLWPEEQIPKELLDLGFRPRDLHLDLDLDADPVAFHDGVDPNIVVVEADAFPTLFEVDWEPTVFESVDDEYQVLAVAHEPTVFEVEDEPTVFESVDTPNDPLSVEHEPTVFEVEDEPTVFIEDPDMKKPPLATKRLYDDRIFGLNVRRKLRKGDTVTDFLSVLASPIGTYDEGDEPADLSVGVPSDDDVAVTNDTQVNFECGEGEVGVTYLIACRYSSTTESQLESVMHVKVVGD